MLGFPFGPFEFGGDMWADPGSFASGSPSARYLQDLPPAPGPMTTTFPPRDPWHDHLDYFSGGNGYEETLAQEAEASTSLAPTKPSYIENNNQSGVSSVFTPLEIMLYKNGLGSSRAAPLRRAREAVTTALRAKSQRRNALFKSAARWGSPRQNLPMRWTRSVEVRQTPKN